MTILKEQTGESKSRNIRHIDFTLCFTANKETSIDPRSQPEDAFTMLYAHAFSGRDQPSGILLQFYPLNWVDEFTIPLRPLEQNSPNVVAEALMKVNEEYGGGFELFDGASEVRIIAVWPLDPKKGINFNVNDLPLFIIFLPNLASHPVIHGECSNIEGELASDHQLPFRLHNLIRVENPNPIQI